MVRLTALMLALMTFAFASGGVVATHSDSSNHCASPGHDPEDPDSGHEDHGEGEGLGHCDDPPSLTLGKAVINDNGGTAVPSDWTLFASGPTSFSGPGPSVSSGPSFAQGTYALNESGPPGYSPSPWVCLGGSQSGSNITLAPGQSATCTITNDDIAPTLTVIKHVVNDNGGSAVASDWMFVVTATNPSPNSFPGSEAGVTVTLDAGPYRVDESGPDGYTETRSSGCSGTLALAATATCIFTNDDIAPTLIVKKHVVNNNGGTAVASNWTMVVTATDPSPNNFPGNESGVLVTLNAGAYSVDESGGPIRYTKSRSSGCTGTLALAATATCTITNTFGEPTTLTVIKHVINDNGGTLVVDDFPLFIDGKPTKSGDPVPVSAGDHVVSETPQPGYTPSIGGDCDESGKVTLAIGENLTCIITNNDNKDDPDPWLTVIKHVINDNGGTAAPDDFKLTVGGEAVLSGATTVVSPNTPIALNETLLEGYTFVSITGDSKCPDFLGGTVTLNPREHVTCTITNDDIAPQLTVIKHVVNDGGGTAVAGEWTMDITATNPSENHFPGMEAPGVTITLDAGDYSVDESGGPSDYAKSPSSGCTGTLALGDSATCTITNTFGVPSTLTVTKIVINDNGGTLVAADFPLFIDGEPITGVPVTPGEHIVSETPHPGYKQTFSGNCDDTGAVTVPIDGSATCIITNDDIAPKLTLNKNVVNDNGGTAPPSAWTLTASGPSGFSGPGPTVSNGTPFLKGTYDLSESALAGYSSTGIWACNGTGTVDDKDTVTLGLGQSLTCTITNDDIVVSPPALTVIPVVKGGSAVADDFGFTLDPDPDPDPGEVFAIGGTATFSNLSPGDYDVDKTTGPPNYEETSNTCRNLAIAGASLECTITYTFIVEQYDTSLHLSISSGSDSATLPGPNATIPAGRAQLRIEERNEGDVALYRVLVTLEGRNSGLLRELSHADLAEGEGRRDDDHILEPDEIWVWLVDVDLAEEEWYEAKSEATNLRGDWHLHEIDPDRPSTLQPDRGQQTTLHVTVEPVLPRTITIVVEATGAPPPPDVQFRFRGDLGEFAAPHTKVMPRGEYEVIHILPPETDSRRQWSLVTATCTTPSTVFDLETLTLRVQVADVPVVCTFFLFLEPTGFSPSRADLMLEILNRDNVYVDRIDVDKGTKVDLRVTFRNRGNVDLKDITIEIRRPDGQLVDAFSADQMLDGDPIMMRSITGVSVDENTTFIATATATAVGANDPGIAPAIVLVAVGDDGCFCGKGVLGIFCLLLIVIIGAVIALSLRYLVFDVIQGNGGGGGDRGGNGKDDKENKDEKEDDKEDEKEDEKEEEEEDEDEEVAPSLILVVNTNPDAREIHLETCQYAPLISAEHREEIEGTPEELDALKTGAPPAQMQEWLERQGYDGCRHCLPQY